MGFGKTDSLMDMGYTALITFFMLASLKKESNMVKEYRPTNLKSTKAFLRLGKEKGKGFCMFKKMSATKVILKKL